MFQDRNKPPKFLITKAKEIWGGSTEKIIWEKVELGVEYLKHHGKKSFICPNNHNNITCELVEMYLCSSPLFSDKGSIYGLGRCLSCEKVYWGRIANKR